MAVQLVDLVEPLKREVAPPGEFVSAFPSSTDTILTGYLQDAFWEARLEGMTALNAYSELNGTVTPISGNTDLSKDFQQLLVFFAGYRIVLTALRTLKTTFRAKAGPVEFETQQSANILRDTLAALKDKRNILLNRLSDLGALPTYYVDAVIARDDAIAFQDIYWVR